MTTENKPSEFNLALLKLVEEFKATAWEFLEERLEGNSEDSLRAYQLNEFVKKNYIYFLYTVFFKYFCI